MGTMTMRQLGQLVGSCVVLGLGVVLLLTADLGSDGYSMFVNGLHLWTSAAFWLMNVLVGVGFVAATWLRGRRPGWGTLIQPVVDQIVQFKEIPARFDAKELIWV